ncbi:MAG: transcriptional repressor [Deltaproteobacteria bacterium]|nr:transcriptional repressor [Deltaproteobacteria bacterium]MBW2069843.1 transcriptional repressor [Deltaproteobacteria bacterium]
MIEKLHQREKEEFTAICLEHGLNESDKRLKVLEAFLRAPDHVTASDLREQLRQRGENFDEQFITETLDLLCRYGYAFKKHFEGQQLQYEHRHIGWHHDHLICAKCGRILEFHNPEMEALQRQIALQYNFSLLHHKMELYGICARCRKQRQPVVPLSFVLPGEKVYIERLAGGRQVQQRLAEMGLTPGTIVEVIKSSAPGPIILAFRGSRLALGHGLGHKILVSPRNNLPQDKLET